MVETAESFKFKILESELEALLVEAELIRVYQPKFNVLLKDDKSPLYIQITDYKFPQVKKIRKKEIIKYKPKGIILGPFSSGYKVQEVLQLARKIFPWCNKKIINETKRNKKERPCFYYHIGLCNGACIGAVSEEEYNNNIKQLELFLKGKKKDVNKTLTAEMKALAENEEFEKASVIRDKLIMIEEITNQSYKLKPELTFQALTEKMHEDGPIYLAEILASYLNLPKKLSLHKIEGYDVSNVQGTNAAVAMVSFVDGQSESKEYKVFNIKTLNTPNDYHMMQEVLTRRQNHPEWLRPDLILIDGGRGQVKAVLKIWQWDTPIIGIAKNPDRLVIPDLNWAKWIRYKDDYNKKNQLLSKLQWNLLKLPDNHPALKLAQQIRDEAHRFSKKQHKKLRSKNMFI